MEPGPERSPHRALRSGLKRVARAGLRNLPWKTRLFRVARVLRPPRAIYRRLPVEGPFSVRIDGGPSFRLLGHGLSTETDLFWGGLGGYDERESLRCWARLCRQSSIIVDVGAYVGVYSLAAAAANPKA